MKVSRLALALALLPAAAGAAGGLHGGKHNLSVTGPGTIKASTETRACIFCHVTHGRREDKGRPETSAVHRTYRSSTSTQVGGTGTNGSSRLCLSCHDGTVAVGLTGYGLIAMRNTGAGGRLPPGRSNLGTDLEGSHPVSFRPTTTRSTHAPPVGDGVKLDKHGRVQCTSCHDPHAEDIDPDSRKFLVKRNVDSEICQSCHSMPFWQQSSHRGDASVPGLSALRFGQNASGGSGCAACHSAHGGSPRRLVKGEATRGDDAVCLDCHDGRTARFDVAREMTKPYAHAAPSHGPSGHDAAEGPTSAHARMPETRAGAPRHVTCVDCHDPHASTTNQLTVAPRAPGSLAGVWGIDRNGLRVDPVNNEYEVCFKCHADSANQPQARGPTPPSTVRRQVADVNLRRVFDTTAASFHPVVAPGRGGVVPSLIPPLGPGSMIYCGDCHASDSATMGAGVPRGPHGSIYPALLARNYATADRTPESPSAYALCYGCHERTVVLSPSSSFPLHERHVVQQATPCSACHNAHGVSALAGTPQNNAHLVDFDVSIVKPNKGLRRYTSRGTRSGSCALSCHGKDHDDLPY